MQCCRRITENDNMRSMATVSEIVQSLNALIAEGSSIAGEKGEVPLLNEKLDQWTRRVHGMLSNWGRGQDANRFSGASYSAQLGQSDRERFWGRAEARLRVLRVLRDDMAAHPEFYEVRDTPKLARETRPILPPKPNKVFLGHGGNPLWSKVHTHLKDELQLNV